MLSRLMQNTILSILVLSIQIFCQAEQINSITGRVIDKSSKEPLPGVNVFISNTFVGTITDSDGYFELKHIPKGTQNLVISMVGYQRMIEEFVAEKSLKNKKKTYRLKPISYKIDQVNIITDKGDWENYYELFREEFIGRREFDSDCSILNPYSIDFIYDDKLDRLTASCDSLLIIKNEALGYQIEILLEKFVWDFGAQINERGYSFQHRFVKLDPENEYQLQEWKTNRLQTYKLSPRYFYSKVIDRLVHQHEFEVQHCRRAGNSIELTGTRCHLSTVNIIKDNRTNQYIIDMPKCLSVVHFDGIQEYKSYLEVPYGSLQLNISKRAIIPGSVIYSGYWSTFRVSDLLPDEYKPISD